MNDFEPGEGWREINEREWLQTPIDSDCVDSIIDGRHRRWVREDPVLPLPTEPYTVIRVTWKTPSPNPDPILVLDGDVWRDENGRVSTSGLLHYISGFEVLAEPVDARFSERAIRKATVLAVLDRIASEPWARQVDLAKWRREFGVAS